MAEIGGQPPSSTVNTNNGSVKGRRPPNPIWKMMGLPNMRLRLPSRNWLIFLSLTGSFSAAVIYDKREKKRAQRKWCKLVEHIALEPLEPRSMPRKLTIYLEGPPTDGLRVAQDHFKDYVKPILVSSGLDWDFVQGRKEGDVRAELAERIRKFRRHMDGDHEEEDPTMRIRKQNGVIEFSGLQGDIVIGRHTWKEYVRGLHEGWLGPITAPREPEKQPDEKQSEPPIESTNAADDILGNTVHSSPADSDTPPAENSSPEAPAEKPKKPPQPSPFITTSAYTSAPTPSFLPVSFGPSVPVSFPHILGFRHTLLRLYRFLNRRHIADSIGHETAAVLLLNHRSYHSSTIPVGSTFSPPADDSQEMALDEPQLSEQAAALVEEERDWHKTTFKRLEGEPERTWIEDMVLDPRIAGRMRRAELSPEDEARARAIVISEEEIEGWIKGSLRSLWRSGKDVVGLGLKESKPVKDFGDEDTD